MLLVVGSGGAIGVRLLAVVNCYHYCCLLLSLWQQNQFGLKRAEDNCFLDYFQINERHTSMIVVGGNNNNNNKRAKTNNTLRTRLLSSYYWNHNMKKLISLSRWLARPPARHLKCSRGKKRT